MAIQTIDTGVDVGLKVGADKYNANFTDTDNMAALLAQTSGADATSGRGVTTDAYQAVTSLGIGVIRLMKNDTGGDITDQASVAGADLSRLQLDSDLTTWLASGAVITGTWLNITGGLVGTDNSGYFVRTA